MGHSCDSLLVQPPESVLNQSGQLIRSAVDGLVQTRCLVSDRDGQAAFEAGSITQRLSLWPFLWLFSSLRWTSTRVM